MRSSRLTHDAHSSLMGLLGLTVSVGTALICWTGRTWVLGPIIVLPVVWLRLTPQRALVCALLYYLVALWPVSMSTALVYPSVSPAIGLAFWLVQAILCALPWWLGAGLRHGYGGASSLLVVPLVVFMTLVPPIGLVEWCHPILGLGWLAPGSGMAGVGLTVVAWSALVAIRDLRWTVSVAALTLGLSGAQALGPTGAPQTSSRPLIGLGVHAVQTQAWPAKTVEEMVHQVEAYALDLKAHPGALVVFPEAALANWRVSTEVTVDRLVRPISGSAAGLFGVTWRDEEDRQFSGALLVDEGRMQWLRSRQPMLIGLWRPWDHDGHHQADWGASAVFSAKGHRFGLLVCVEAMSPWWTFVEWMDSSSQPEALVTVANTWWAIDPVVEVSQYAHGLAAARIMGVPYFQSHNHGVLNPRPGSWP